MSICRNEIVFLKKEEQVLLRKIRLQERYMNYQEQNATLLPTDVTELVELILKFFRVLSLIDAYSFFQLQNQTVTDENSIFFITMVNNRYLTRLNKFTNDLMFAIFLMSHRDNNNNSNSN